MLETGAKFFARCRQILEKFHLAIEMDQEGFVFFFAQNVIEERVAGALFLIEDAPLAEAGVNEQAEGERQIAFACEIFDGLRAGVFLEREVRLIQVGDDFPVLVADGGVHGDEFYFGGDFGLRLRRRLLLRLGLRRRRRR